MGGEALGEGIQGTVLTAEEQLAEATKWAEVDDYQWA